MVVLDQEEHQPLIPESIHASLIGVTLLLGHSNILLIFIDRIKFVDCVLFFREKGWILSSTVFPRLPECFACLSCLIFFQS